MDQFAGLSKLAKDVDGAPNLRQAGEFPVFGCAQPTLEGIQGVLEKQQKMSMDKVLWINLRSEPVLYINDHSYAPRDKRRLDYAMNLGGLTSQQYAQLDERLASRIKTDCKRSNGFLNYFREEADGHDTKQLEEVQDANKIKTIAAAYEALKTEQDFSVEFQRLLLNDDEAPSLEVFDKLVEWIKDLDANHAITFNCYNGGERTTTAMVIACLIRKALDHEEKEEEAPQAEPEIIEAEIEVEDEEGWEDLEDEEIEQKRNEKRARIAAQLRAEREAREKKRKQEEQDEEEERDIKQGQYAVIMKLLKLLPKGARLKADVDEVIEKNKHLHHLRDAILAAKETFDKEHVMTQMKWKAAATNALQRYFYLILFYAYLKETAKAEKPFPVAFSKWVVDHGNLTAVLSSAGEFNWA
jgi:protein-tyrosine phosphatase